MKDDLKFSQRIGITPVTKKLQVDSMDDDLRNSLWNEYHPILIEISATDDPEYNPRGGKPTQYFSFILYSVFFKKRLEDISILGLDGPDLMVTKNFTFEKVVDNIRTYFFECKWFEVYDLIEFTLEKFRGSHPTSYFSIKGTINEFNEILKRENSAYRFINKKLAPITNSNEIEEIQKAIAISGSFTALEGCNIHLTEALNKLSDKQNPDYRNSIKESISAVESIAKVISGRKNDTLKPALDKINKKLKLHDKLVLGLKRLFDYTSDADGIRHGIEDSPNCDIEDARFMLVSCSAFVNYLIAKAEKADIKLT